MVGAAAEVNRYEIALSDIFGIDRPTDWSLDGIRQEYSKRYAKPKPLVLTGATDWPQPLGTFEINFDAR